MISGYSLVAGVALGWLCVIRLCPQNEKTRLTSLAMIVTLRDTSLAILWVQIFLSKKCWVQIWCPKKNLSWKIFGSKHKETTGICRQWQKLVNCLTCLWLESFFYFLRLMTFPVVSFENWPINCNFCSPYKNSETSQQKSRKCVFRPFLNRHQKKLFYSLLLIRPKYYESSKTEYSDSTSFINRLTPLILFLGFWNFFEGLKGGFPQKMSTFFCFSPLLI